MAIIFEANHNFELDNSAAFIAHARQDIPALVAEVRRLNNLVEAFEFLTEDETGMLSDAPLTPEKLEEILRLLKDQRDYAAETAEMHAKEVERLRVELFESNKRHLENYENNERLKIALENEQDQFAKRNAENARLRAALKLAKPFLREEIINPDNYNCAYCDDDEGNHKDDCKQLLAYLACVEALKGGAE